MGDKSTLSKARQELEDLYYGIPDESVNLTFKDLVDIQQNIGGGENKFSTKDATIYENMSKEMKENLQSLSKSTSIDFAKSLQVSKEEHHIKYEIRHERTPPRRNAGLRSVVERSLLHDDVSARSTTSPFSERGGRTRAGIPHTNICTVCSQYIYILRHRCLVCGRAYCRRCVRIGMGEMTEGRKCIECLGRRFSPRYIGRAADIGCCIGHPSVVKQQELKWAEKGPRRSGERRNGRSMVASGSLSPIGTSARAQMPSNPSFVTNSSPIIIPF